MVILLLKTGSTAADPGRFKDLSPSEQQRLDQGKVIVFLHSVNSPIKEGTAIGIVEAPVEVVFNVVTANEEFAEFMPYVTKSRVKMAPEGVLLNYQYLDLPFPVGDRHYAIKIRNSRKFQDGQLLLSSSWTYLKDSGNIKDTYGSWLLKPYGVNKTLAQYIVCTDPGGDIPNWAQNMATKISLPKIITRVRERVAALQRAKPTGNAENPVRERSTPPP